MPAKGNFLGTNAPVNAGESTLKQKKVHVWKAFWASTLGEQDAFQTSVTGKLGSQPLNRRENWRHAVKKIIVVRHGERDGSVGGKGGKDALSPHGKEQVRATAARLEELGYTPELFIGSGLNRTAEAITEMAAVVFKFGDSFKFTVNTNFDFTPTLKQFLGNADGFYGEVGRMKTALVIEQLTVEHAIRHSSYALHGRVLVNRGLQDVEKALGERATALVASHSPWTELAVFNPGSIPYGIGEADAIVYTIDSGCVLASEHIPGPLGGGKHT